MVSGYVSVFVVLFGFCLIALLLPVSS